VHSIDDLPPYEDYAMQGRTYRYMNQEPLYPFGFGLSYAEFEYGPVVSSSKTLKAGDKLQLKMTLKNNSDRTAEEVVQVYVTKVNRSDNDPNCSLKAFNRFEIPGNSEKLVEFELDAKAFSVYDGKGDLQLEKGDYEVFLSSSAPISRSLTLGAPTYRSVRVHVR